jgi:hypothetical protein
VTTDEPRWPTVRSWLGPRPSSSHPVVEALEGVEGGLPGYREFLDALEEQLALLEGAKPARWVGKRKVFRAVRDDAALLQLKAELAVASMLVRGSELFEFGDTKVANPDLVLASAGFGIEVTSKTPWGLHQLYAAVRDAVEATPASVHLHLSEYPVALDEIEAATLAAEVQDVAARVASTRAGGVIERSISGTTEVGRRHPILVQAQVLPVPALMGGSKVTFETGGQELVGLQLAERMVMLVADDPRKARQAHSMSTLLLVDVTRLGPSWMRPPRVWSHRLTSLIPEDFPFAAVGVFLSNVDQVGIREVAVAASRTATPAELDGLRALSTALGYDAGRVGPGQS